MFEVKIFFKDENPDKLKRIFYPESKSLRTERFSYRLRKLKDSVVISVVANDAVAFKTVKTTVSKLLDVYKKMKALS